MQSALFIRMSATVFVQPLDLVKNRMQLSGKNGFCAWLLTCIFMSGFVSQSGCCQGLILLSLVIVIMSVFLSGEKGAAREHKSTFHAIGKIVRNEGVLSVYNG